MRSSQVSSLSVESQTQTDSPPRRGFGLRDIVPLVIAVLAGLVCYGLFFKRSAWLSVIGYSVSPAERVMNGEIPYRDFLYNYTPGMLWLNALLMNAFGVSMPVIHSGLFAFKMLTLVALYFVAKRLTSGWIALIPVTLTLAWLGHKYIFGVVPTQYSLLFVLVGMIFMLNYDRSNNWVWLLLSGMAVGVVFIFKYNVGVLLVGTGTTVVFIRDLISLTPEPVFKRLLAAIKQALLYWAGFAAVTAALMIYMASNNALGPMIDHFLHHAAEYSEARAVPLPPIKWIGPAVIALLVASAGAAAVLRFKPNLLELYLVGVLIAGAVVLFFPGKLQVMKASGTALVAYFPVFLFIGVAALLAWSFNKEAKTSEGRQKWWARSSAIIIVGLFALGAFLEMYPRADYYHLVRVLPAIFILLLLMIIRWAKGLDGLFKDRLHAPQRAIFLCASIPLVLLAFVGIKDTWQPQFDSSFRFIDREPLSIPRAEGIKVSRKQKEFIEGMTRAIEENSAPEDQIFSFAQRGTGFYFLSARRNPTRFVWWRSVGIKKDARNSVLEMIAERRPKLVLVQDSLTDPRVREAVNANYHKVTAVADIAVYDRNQ